jgi:hypothetical protein
MAALMKIGGWKSVRMVMRYAHANVDEFADTMSRLPGGLLGEPKNAKGNFA